MATLLLDDRPLCYPRLWSALLCVLIFSVLARRLIHAKTLPKTGANPLPRLRGLPWLGRFWGVPDAGIDAARHFGALHKKLGPIYEWKVMGTTHIWIQSDKIARELFVTRQRIYCDRNELPACIGVREGSEVLPLMGYGEQTRRYKNFGHSIMRHASADNKALHGWPESENKKTLRRLLERPDRWSEAMIVHCARTVAGIAWGNPKHGSKLLIIVPHLLKAVSPAGSIANKLTFLSHIPEIISPFKRLEKSRKQQMTDAFCEAFDEARDRKGSIPDCWSKAWLEDARGLDPYEATHAIGSSSFVAIATIGGPLHAFFLAMCLYPSWQIEVQEEIDRVCGQRPPDGSVKTLAQLPKLRATVKELVRWRQSTPLGVPHVALQDDVYEGYHIPKGAILHANHYLISREESLYPDGDEFVPQRWLDPSYLTYRVPLSEFPSLSAGDRPFGYGNRSCPGVYLTSCELVTLTGSILWAFTVKRPEGVRGASIPWYETSPWVITMTKPFPCDIAVRNEEKRRLILEGSPNGGCNLIKDSLEDCKSRWDVCRNGKVFTWDGLAEQAS